MTVRELADHFGVTLKTVRRDLIVLRQVGFPVAETAGDHGRKTWTVVSSADGPQLRFTFDEAVALYLGRRFLEPLAGTLFWDAARRAYAKIGAWLTPGALRAVEKLLPSFVRTAVGASDYSKKSALLDDLSRAIEDHRITHVVYQSARATEPVSYDIYPLGLVYHRGALYVVGLAPRREGQPRHWKVDRIEAVQVTGLQFQPPEGFDLRKHLAGSFGIFEGHGDLTIKVRFSACVARYVTEGRWHESQKLTPQKDGSLLAEFRLSGTEEIKSWLLGFGRNAVVLEPKEFRDEMAAELHATACLYDAASDGVEIENGKGRRERGERRSRPGRD